MDHDKDGSLFVPQGSGISARLRAAREKAKLSLDDVAKRTRVPKRHLLAIEEGDFARLPALTYASGFVKSYARAVDVDPIEAALQFRAEADPDPTPEADDLTPVDVSRVPTKRLAIVMAAIVLALGVLLFLWRGGIFETQAPIEIATANGKQAAAEMTVADQPASGEPAAPAAAAPAGGPVVLTAGEDVWIKVYDRDNQTIRQGIMAAGERWEVPGDPSALLLWTGRAGALSITVGGRTVGTLGGPSETIRDISLDPASLVARQPTPAATPLSPPAAPGA
jgi:cytoskeletal protein RodZ